jgi:hypothetical protein
MPPTLSSSSSSRSNAPRLSRGACCALLAVPVGIGLGIGCGGSKGTTTTSGFGGTAATTSGSSSSSQSGTTNGTGGTGGNIFQTTSTGSMGGGANGCDPGTPTKGPTQWGLKNSEMSGTQNVLGLATDPSGNVLVAGSAGKNSSITLGSLPPVSASANDSNAFVAQIGPSGTPNWSVGLVTSGTSSNGLIDSTARTVTSDEMGNVYVGGDFNGTLTLGTLSITSAGTGHFFGDAFVAEYDSTGTTPKALLRFGDPAATTPSNGGGAQEVQGLAIHSTSTGDVLAVVGQFESKLDLSIYPGSNGTILQTSSGDNQPVGFLVVMRTADNSIVFSMQFGDGSVQQSVFGVAFDPSGDVLVTGNTTGAINFPSGPMLTPTGVQAAFVAKIKGDGSATSWANLYGSMSASGAGIASDTTGDVFVAGQHAGTIDFGGGPLTALGSSNAFVAKLDTNGKYVWAHSYGNGSAAEANGIAVDATGHAIVAGAFEGSINFGTSGLATLTSMGQDDIFVAKLDTHGCLFWSQRFGDSQEQSGNAVAVDAMGNTVIGGNMFGSVNFGPGPLTAPSMTENLFVAKFGP